MKKSVLILISGISFLFASSMQFEMMDVNKDGSISQEEFNKMRNSKMEKSKGMKNYSKQPTFEDLDTNYDGVLSNKEFNHMQKVRFQDRSEERQTYKHNLKRGQMLDAGKMSDTWEKDKKIETKGLYE